MRLVVLILLLFPSLSSSADLYKALFEPETTEEEACKYILAAFAGLWILMLCSVFTCWLIRRRPVPAYTYELIPDASSVASKVASLPPSQLAPSQKTIPTPTTDPKEMKSTPKTEPKESASGPKEEKTAPDSKKKSSTRKSARTRI